MNKPKYLFDSNIIIKLWKDYDKLIEELDTRFKIDFIIVNDIATELAKKEYTNYNGIAVLSDRFIKLLPHIVDMDINVDLNEFCTKIGGKSTNSGITYYISGNKLSKIDFSIISLCSNHADYVLVTEDKKLLKSSKEVLGNSKSLSFNEFLNVIAYDSIY